VNSTEALIALGAILLIFGYLGFRHGSRAELTTLALILGLRWLLERRGDELVLWINRLYQAFLFLRRGGLTAEDPSRVFATVRSAQPLISADFKPTFLVGLTVLVVIAAYAIGRLLRAGSSLIGMLLGLVNGYIIIQFFVSLLPRRLPEPLSILMGRPSPAGDEEIRAMTAPVRHLLSEYDTYVVLAIVGVILIWVVGSIQPAKGGQSGGKG